MVFRCPYAYVYAMDLVATMWAHIMSYFILSLEGIKFDMSDKNPFGA